MTRKPSAYKKPVFGQLDWLELIALITGAWFVVAPYPYTVLFSVLLVLPIAGLIVNSLTGRPNMTSLVTVRYKAGKANYDPRDFIDIPALALLIRVLIDFQLENLISIVVPVLVTFAGMMLLLFLTHKRIRNNSKKWLIYAMLTGNLFMYSYSAVNGINCVFDNSEVKIYHAEVLSKYTSRRKNGITYYVRVAPWGTHRELEDVVVEPELWSSVRRNDSIAIDVKEGLLGIRWISVENKKIGNRTH